MKNKPYPLNKTVHPEHFRQVIDLPAEKSPDGTAFVFTRNRQQGSVTYARFREEAASAMAWMKHDGLVHKHIAIASENSYDWILLFFASMLLENTIIPIDPQLPEEEILSLLERADTDVLFVDSKTRKRLKTIEDHAFLVENLAMVPLKVEEYEPDFNLYTSMEPDPEAIALIYYTSGTTGLPKGVMLTQRNIMEDIAGSVEVFSFEGKTVSVLPYHHSFGLTTSVLMAFYLVGEITICPSLRRVQKVIREAQPNTLVLVPVFLETFHKKVWESVRKAGQEKRVRTLMAIGENLYRHGIDIRRQLMKTIRQAFGGRLDEVISGGAPLPQNIIDDFHAWGIQILVGYGMTECSPVISVNRNHFIKPGSSGRVMDEAQIQIAPDGEILIKGSIVAKGYYKDEEQTREAFVDGWFHSGDLGRIDEDRFIYIEGRKKNLIILSSGENVSPELIEDALMEEKGVEEILVLGRNGRITAIIYPAEEYRDQPEYFDQVIAKYNQTQPTYRQIQVLELRDQPFEKTAAMKIKRKGSNEQ